MAKHTILKNFYKSKEWTQFRMMLIQQRGPICSRCGSIIPDSVNLIGHHKVELTPENVYDATISLNPEKVDLICFDCHNREHRRFGYQNQSRQVFLVYGPPLSGKTTFVKQNMERGDLVVDLNLIYESVTMLPGYDKPDVLRPNVFGIRNLLIDQIRTRFGKWHDAWIVGGYPDKYQRDKLIEELGAQPIFCDVSKDECVARLQAEESLRYRKAEWAGYIDKWFEQYQP
jgi:hypothetical protein